MLILTFQLILIKMYLSNRVNLSLVFGKATCICCLVFCPFSEFCNTK